MGKNAAQCEPFGPGVWKALYRIDGHEILIAIDQAMDCVKIVVLRPGVDEAAAEAYLKRLLAARARPRLQLVREPPPSPAYDKGVWLRLSHHSSSP